MSAGFVEAPRKRLLERFFLFERGVEVDEPKLVDDIFPSCSELLPPCIIAVNARRAIDFR